MKKARPREEETSNSSDEKTPKKTKTTIIGTNTNQRFGYGNNPIKDALKRQSMNLKRSQ